jgi:hypothetical protein
MARADDNAAMGFAGQAYKATLEGLCGSYRISLMPRRSAIIPSGMGMGTPGTRSMIFAASASGLPRSASPIHRSLAAAAPFQALDHIGHHVPLAVGSAH